MAIHTRSTQTFAVDEAVTETAFARLFDETMLWPALYDVRISTGKQEVAASHGELGDWEVKLETAEAAEDNITQQFKKTFTHDAYAKVIRLSRELIDDEDVGFVTDAARQLGERAAITMERRGAAVFNTALNTTEYSTEGGLSLGNNAHLNVDSGNSQDNLGALTLSHANAKTVRTAMRRFKGYRDSNEIISVNPDELLVPPDLEEDAFALIQSTLKPGSQNNDANIFAGRMTVYVWTWLTQTDRWFMMDSRRRREALRWYQRVGVEIMSDAAFSQGVRKIGGYMRFSNGYTDWRWVYVNDVSGS